MESAKLERHRRRRRRTESVDEREATDEEADGDE